ncbi:hypothetical protein [Nonomuraea sp. KM88]|uniref:hypothetical protein n=1 Tax=Nonomuraea sp. KM88 TaxID=3457427 RepID=UPI003FCCCFF6
MLVALGRADCRLLDTYEGERRPLAQKVLWATSTAVDIMLPSTRGKRLVRDKFVVPVLRLPLSSASCGWAPPNSASATGTGRSCPGARAGGRPARARGTACRIFGASVGRDHPKPPARHGSWRPPFLSVLSFDPTSEPCSALKVVAGRLTCRST